MQEQNYFNEIPTEQDLIFLWVQLLKEKQCTHVEIDLDKLVFGLIDSTRTHYMRMDVHRPQMQALEDFDRTRWHWKRLKEKIAQSK